MLLTSLIVDVCSIIVATGRTDSSTVLRFRPFLDGQLCFTFFPISSFSNLGNLPYTIVGGASKTRARHGRMAEDPCARCPGDLVRSAEICYHIGASWCREAVAKVVRLPSCRVGIFEVCQPAVAFSIANSPRLQYMGTCLLSQGSGCGKRKKGKAIRPPTQATALWFHWRCQKLLLQL